MTGGDGVTGRGNVSEALRRCLGGGGGEGEGYIFRQTIEMVWDLHTQFLQSANTHPRFTLCCAVG